MGRNRKGVGGLGSRLHGNPKHGVTDVIHPAVHLLLPPHAPVCHPTLPRGAKRLFRGWQDAGPHVTPQSRSASCPLDIFTRLISKVDELASSATLTRKVAVQLMSSRTFTGSLVLLHGSGVTLMFPPHCCSTNDACRSWLLASVSHFLHTQFDCF